MEQRSVWKRYGFAWVTAALFVITLSGHWIFGWFAYVNEQHALQQPVDLGGYTVEMMRDTLENWQSEFLQLLWQVAGLAYLLYIGSPQSREGDDRKEALLEHIVRKVDPEGDKKIKELEKQYPKK